MRRAALLALGLMVVGICWQDSARAQTSATPPVSLTPPKASPPRAGTKSSPRTSASVPSTPATSGPPQLPSPAAAADYDGFSVGPDDHDAPSQVTPPARSRAANGLDAQSLVDQEDEALKRKLTICKNCK
ncbi:hypothetical protein EAS56_12195 [Bradyrhizobium guangzhouense]|uniref:Uncharacterized protein n=1 Tax=Bradyrhizobium guangzhouense TaxID=1325095 RepID=A0AAE6C9R0_9BRAD|nr:hypothetical protein [Bradyrhizobium guangzhouense]QAU48041.1 hypothetical protein XH91_23645 [Bradyrhizobium guangzhouense]RXH14600.1 hypothetical protein EAS56_12195 [Bradyrhizobium guangzhouense]